MRDLASQIITAIVLVALVGLYIFWPSDGEAAAPLGTCVFALDVDGSTAEVDGLHQQYLEWMEQIVLTECLDLNARVVAVPLTYQTSTDPLPIVSGSLIGEGLSGNSENDETRHEHAAARFLTDATAMLTTGSAVRVDTGTDLIAMGKVVDGFFVGRSTEPMRLYVFTDAVHRRAPHNFATIDLSTAGVDGMVARLTDQLGDLEGVQVQMYGTGVGIGTTDFSPERLSGIEYFWTEYFNASGASLVAYAKQPAF